MSLKWTRNQSESGILRKSEPKEKKEELFVFGYSCKLFRDDDKALHIDQGKHLIPWMGDETLKIDRYDARGALHDLSTLEAPSGGFDWRVELTKNELDVEQLCDEERYRALHTDEDEEEMYKEEELKRLHAAGYGQVGFNYDAPAEPSPTSQTTEVDEPFEPMASLRALLPVDIVLPETLKQNAIIEKTAKFIASQGTQMEILIKAKQGDNPQFQFLVRDSLLHPYYMALIALVKAGKWPEKAPEVVEEKPHENEEYLHPSLASTIIESAPSIPSIHYKPSADCDYTMLISKMRGDTVVEEMYSPELAPGEVAPPGTEPLVPARDHAQITRAPVMYHTEGAANQTPEQSHAAYQQYAAYYHQYMAQAAQAAETAKSAQAAQLQVQRKNDQPPTTLKSTGLSLMKNYNTDSESDDSDYDDASSTDSKEKQQVTTPPEDIQIVIDKMASYVARNGDEFADIVRAKNDPRFTFLDPENIYHPYYKRLMQQKRGVDVNGKEKKEKKSKAPVSFSIKKMKEPDPILPRPALPYESSSDEDSEKTDKQTDKVEQTNEPPKLSTQLYQVNNIPPVVVYKMEGLLTQDLPSVRTIETVKTMPKITQNSIQNTIQNPIQNVIQTVPEDIETPKEESSQENEIKEAEVPVVKEPTPIREEKKEKSPSPKKENKRYKEKKKDSKVKSESKSKRSERRSEDKEKRKREREREDRDRKRSQYKDDLETEIITLEDNSDDLIDLTGDQSDSKVECENEAERAKQLERRRRAAEFLKKVGVDPAAAALPTSSLASAMVDTLESLRKKKAEEEEKRRRREKRRHRERRDYEDERSNRRSKRRKYNKSSEDDSDCDNSKKKKRKKERKHSKSKKKRRREGSEEQDQPLPANIDLMNTLKELRNTSPTKEFVLQKVVVQRQDSSGEERGKSGKDVKRKREREYSEGEWSSDSERDSASDDYETNKKD